MKLTKNDLLNLIKSYPIKERSLNDIHLFIKPYIKYDATEDKFTYNESLLEKTYQDDLYSLLRILKNDLQTDRLVFLDFSKHTGYFTGGHCRVKD